MSHIFTVCTYYCHKLLEPPSQIVTLFLFFIKHFPMPTITTTYITNMWKFGKVALDSSQTFITHFCQFICSYLRIQSNLIFYPFIKIVVLSAILSIILSATLSAILSAIT